LVVDGNLFGAHRPAVAEIGHLRPGLESIGREQTVEALAAGPAIEAAARRRMCDQPTKDLAAKDIDDLRGRTRGVVDHLTARAIAEAAASGNSLARSVLVEAARALGWAIAQVAAVVAPEVVVVGGGVSLADESVFLGPVREMAARYVFPPLAGSFSIVPAELGEEVVVHGALALASGAL
ncbi:MAG TPA: ROK family protein, partial [Planctomycetaceae bacterium]|nr:ROK family protein [Planctomycetaceae bacterium]